MRIDPYLDDSDLDILLYIYDLDDPLLDNSEYARGWVGNDLLAVRKLEQIGFLRHENGEWNCTNSGILYIVNKGLS